MIRRLTRPIKNTEGTHQMVEISLRPSAAIAPHQKTQAAALVYESFPEYYDLIPAPSENRLEIIASHFETEGTETFGSTVALDEQGSVLGVYSALPATELKRAQIFTSALILRSLEQTNRSEFRRRLEGFSGQVPEVPDDSFYLSRIAVAVEIRGSGVAGRLLSGFQDEAADFPRCSVHVRADNAQAIRFYRKHGFDDLQHDPARYLVMVLENRPSAR